jgi:predicted nuclease with RNAse H fold
MPLTEPVFIGVDPTSGRMSFTYAALDRDLHVITIAEGELEDVVSFLERQTSVVVAINAPSGLNRGLVGRKMKKEAGADHLIRGAQMRLAEYELRQRGIAVSGTPSTLAACPPWMQTGFTLYRKLEKMGFTKYAEKDTQFQVLETHPHASYCVLTETIPQPKPSLEGRLQRQLALYENDVRVKDPMDFFEEITRHKMLKGVWPVEVLHLPEQLDALVAAYTAWLVWRKPEKTSSFGDNKEGRIFLPKNELKEKY